MESRSVARTYPWMRVLRLLVAATAAMLMSGAGVGQDLLERRDNPPFVTPIGSDHPVNSVAPFAASPTSVVDQMLNLAGVGPNDVVVDLGSGDGRLVIAAVQRYGARSGFGVDIDLSLVRYANLKAEEGGLQDRARFYARDLFETDIREATVVTVYLLPDIMPRLQAKLLAELAPGSRVVSHDYPFPSWRADRVVSFDVPEKNDYTGRRNTSIYLYTVPARASPSSGRQPT